MNYHYYDNTIKKVLESSGNRKIVIYGLNKLSESFLHGFVNFGVHVGYFVTENPQVSSFCGSEVKSVYDILYEEEKIYVVVLLYSNHGRAYSLLNGIGLTEYDDFCILSIGGYIQKYDAVDLLLGYNRMYEGLWGFKIYGDINDNSALRILTLGGSTSDPTMGNNISWPEFLYGLLNRHRSVIVFSGGIGGYSINQEFLKFVRDGIPLNPDIVITLDGFNDVGYQVTSPDYPFCHKYMLRIVNDLRDKGYKSPDTMDLRNNDQIAMGMKSPQKTDVENLLTGMKLFNGVCSGIGAQYFAFFQPMIKSGKAIVDDVVLEIAEEYYNNNEGASDTAESIPAFAEKVSESIRGYDYIYDLTSIFDEKKDVYYDICHYTDNGNRIVAESIYLTIKDSVMEK